MTKIYYQLLTILILIPAISNAQKTPCENGMAGEYPCSNIDLIGHLSTDELLAEEKDGVLLNDIWGWTDPDTGKEYAIIGMANGTSFVDISDPENPVMLGILPEHHAAGSHKSSGKPQHDGGNSVWRDVKVYQNHAFIVSEDAGHGMQVFDLTDLRSVTNAPEEFLEAGHYDGIGRAHNIIINEETGFAYAVGARGASTCGDGGLHIINIQDPKNPVYEACFDEDGYTHDAQCVIYNGPDTDYQGKEVCFNSNEDTITIVNVDDKNNMQQISRTGYEGSSYTHQGWLTEDHKYFISNDETDELDFGVNTTTYIWNVQDLDSPIYMGEFIHSTKSIDHNLYIVGNEVYESNYSSGLRILEMTNIAEAELNLLGYFDTYPANNNTNFDGNWSNYPFFESGVIAVSDITNGLFLLKISDTFKTTVTQQPSDIEICEGEHYDLGFEVSGKDLSYRWQLNTGSGFQDIVDFEAYTNTYSNKLHIHTVNSSQNQYKFRCKISSPHDDVTFTEPATLTVKTAPIVDFDYTYEESTVYFTNQTLFGDEYFWDFGDNSSGSKSESPTRIYNPDILEYDVTLSSSNDCGSSELTKTIAFVITDLIDEHDPSYVNIYPIPTNGDLNIIDSNDAFKAFSIYDTSGNMISSGKLSGIETTINIKSLQKGLYLLELVSDEGDKLVRRFILE